MFATSLGVNDACFVIAANPKPGSGAAEAGEGAQSSNSAAEVCGSLYFMLYLRVFSAVISAGKGFWGIQAGTEEFVVHFKVLY